LLPQIDVRTLFVVLALGFRAFWECYYAKVCLTRPGAFIRFSSSFFVNFIRFSSFEL
jgi:hypothetical protein